MDPQAVDLEEQRRLAYPPRRRRLAAPQQLRGPAHAPHHRHMRHAAAGLGEEGGRRLAVGFLGRAPYQPQKRAGRQSRPGRDRQQLVEQGAAPPEFVDEHGALELDRADERDELAPRPVVGRPAAGHGSAQRFVELGKAGRHHAREQGLPVRGDNRLERFEVLDLEQFRHVVGAERRHGVGARGKIHREGPFSRLLWLRHPQAYRRALFLR